MALLQHRRRPTAAPTRPTAGARTGLSAMSDLAHALARKTAHRTVRKTAHGTAHGMAAMIAPRIACIARHLAGAAVIVAASGGMAPAQPAVPLDGSLAPCLDTPMAPDALLDALGTAGWRQTEADALDDAGLQKLAAAMLPGQLGGGAVADDVWASTWQRALRNADGVRRQTVLPGNRAAQRFLLRHDSGTLLDLSHSVQSGTMMITCRISATSDFTTAKLDVLFPKRLAPVDSRPPIARMPLRIVPSAGTNRALVMFRFDTDRIADVLGGDLDVAAIVETSLFSRVEK